MSWWLLLSEESNGERQSCFAEWRVPRFFTPTSTDEDERSSWRNAFFLFVQRGSSVKDKIGLQVWGRQNLTWPLWSEYQNMRLASYFY